MKRVFAFAAVFVVGCIVGGMAAVPGVAKKYAALGFQRGQHETRLEAIKNDAATMKAGRFVWTGRE